MVSYFKSPVDVSSRRLVKKRIYGYDAKSDEFFRDVLVLWSQVFRVEDPKYDGITLFTIVRWREEFVEYC